MYVSFLLIFFSAVTISYCGNGVPIAVLPPLEVRARYPQGYIPPVNSLHHPMDSEFRMPEQPPQRRREQYTTQKEDFRSEDENTDDSFDEIIQAFGLADSEPQDSNHISRAVGRDYYDFQNNPAAYQQQPYPQVPAQGYNPAPLQRPNNAVMYEGPYQKPNPAYSSQPPQAPQQSQYQPSSKTLSLLKPLAIDFLKPFSSKVGNKVGGLLSLILALLGSSANAAGLTGFKEILINGIVKPLFQLKGGLKAVISKLAIPLISLLLINVEVLITIWWLWEDCEQPQVHPAPIKQYNKPVYPSTNYSPY